MQLKQGHLHTALVYTSKSIKGRFTVCVSDCYINANGVTGEQYVEPKCRILSLPIRHCLTLWTLIEGNQWLLWSLNLMPLTCQARVRNKCKWELLFLIYISFSHVFAKKMHMYIAYGYVMLYSASNAQLKPFSHIFHSLMMLKK